MSCLNETVLYFKSSVKFILIKLFFLIVFQMSITYSADVANTKVWTVYKILFKWNGSMYRRLWIEALFFLFIYESFSIIYHYILTNTAFPLANKVLTYIILQCRRTYKIIPITFVLGFYITMVLNQWFNQYKAVPWTDDIAFFTSAFIHGKTERAVQIRRAIVRYVNLSYLIAARTLFGDFKAQFPNEQQIVKSGLISDNELQRINSIHSTINKYFVPLSWAMSLIYTANNEKMIKSDRCFDALLEKIASFRGQIGYLYLLDQINPPLAYSQVAGLVVYGYLFGAMIGLQKLDEDQYNMTGFLIVTFPPFETLIIIFYIGWYKIGENLINPYGETEYNFDIIYSLQRNLQVAYLIVDQLHGLHPTILEEAQTQNFESDQSVTMPEFSDIQLS